MRPSERSRRIVLIGFLLLWAAGCTAFIARTPAPQYAEAPRALSDKEFWRIVSEFSEEGGRFPSDNLVSNETWFQHVIPALVTRTQGGAYLGVGPDQNFTYIVALRPQLAFIVDLRRDNLMLHLLYKAIIEQSSDRAAFLSRLFSRPRPPGLRRDGDVASLFKAYALVQPSDELFRRNLRAVISRLTEHHHFVLAQEDRDALTTVYTAFFQAGPDLQYSIRGGASLRFPTYAELVQETDSDGRLRSYLATEDQFRVLKNLEEHNLIVPVVGDFGGEKALPAIGQYLAAHRMRISAFYVSNVEQYLFQDPTGTAWRRFYAQLAALPADERSMIIRSYNLRLVRPAAGLPTVQLATVLDSLEECVRAVSSGHIATYADVIGRPQ